MAFRKKNIDKRYCSSKQVPPLILLALLCLMAFNLPAQEFISFKFDPSDSLKNILKDLPTPQKLDTLIASIQNLQVHKPHEALKLTLEAEKIANEDGSLRNIVHVKLKAAEIYLEISNLVKAQQYYEKVISLCEYKKDYASSYAKANVGLSGIYLKELRYEKSLDLLLSTLQYVKKQKGNLKEETALIYKNLGSLYLLQNNLPLAKRYYQQAVSLYREINRPEELSKLYNNLGICHESEPNKALNYYLKSLKIKKDLKLDIISSLGNLGVFHMRQRNYAKALEYYQKAQEILEIQQDTSRLRQTYYNLASLYLLQKDYTEAENFVRKLESTLKKGEDYSAWLYFYKTQAEVLAGFQQYDRAYQFQQKYLQLKDSIDTASKKEELAKVKQYYELEDSQQENELLRKDNELNKFRLNRIRYAFYVAVACLIALAFAIYVIYQNLRRRRLINHELDKKVAARTEEQQRLIEGLERANTELDTFLYKASHDLKGPLTTMDGVCNVALLEIQDNKAAEYFKMQKKVIHNMQLLIFRIIEIGDIRNHEVLKSPVNLLRFTKRMFRSMNRVQGFQNIEYQVDLPPNLHINTDAEMLDIVLDNIIKNAIQHAQFHDIEQKEAKPIVRIYTETDSTKFKVHISNNGHPISPDIQNQIFDMFFRGTQDVEGFGLGLYKSKIALEKVGGELILSKSNAEATIFSILLPNQAISYTTYQQR